MWMVLSLALLGDAPVHFCLLLWAPWVLQYEGGKGRAQRRARNSCLRKEGTSFLYHLLSTYCVGVIRGDFAKRTFITPVQGNEQVYIATVILEDTSKMWR
ncbi:hypothetical protein JRQ81_013891 [Phrynocephalus forsythii]|uniref:Uncharacterized protein n=1 Tax=Phrynocephalus forsythii TaxID=171643 RepID=A0A9Q1B2L0_9SAUR|nr:hypothetical protein JRQ81_013891 [Phrynocephalus forsythii]